MEHLKKSEYSEGDSNHSKLVGKSVVPRFRNTFLQSSGTVEATAPRTATATPQTLGHDCVGILRQALQQR